MRVAVGLASGIGNVCLMMPTIKAIHDAGFETILEAQTDFDMLDLLRRCRYADEVRFARSLQDDALRVCGMWRPAVWNADRSVFHSRCLPPYPRPEFQTNFEVARYLAIPGDIPDASDWCRDLDRTVRWDVGIIPGCKGGSWLRKRLPVLAQVAEQLIDRGYRVSVHGMQSDGIDEIPGEKISTPLVEAPDTLAGCRMVITTDSGLGHLANSLGVPTVMVFTATSFSKARPQHEPYTIVRREDLPCSPCHSRSSWHTCKDWKCREVPAETIIAAATAYLKEG